ncbi:MAG: T9SS type A sorting domain-containing protein [candidate division Zixibacteria bacterium]|nr:T9SS type A sorting domain-containing protein [candidate division Zixibacteria bacterium]
MKKAIFCLILTTFIIVSHAGSILFAQSGIKNGINDLGIEQHCYESFEIGVSLCIESDTSILYGPIGKCGCIEMEIMNVEGCLLELNVFRNISCESEYYFDVVIGCYGTFSASDCDSILACEERARERYNNCKESMGEKKLGIFKQFPSVRLIKSYPNPFNAKTEIIFTLDESSAVNIEIYNITGQKVETILDDELNEGVHAITWDASAVSSGIYFYKLTAGNYVTTKKMNLLK